MTRGLIVSAPRSGSGKTVLTLGLMRGFSRRGLRVAGLKSGPDYIDPAFHAVATGRDSLNLDTWAMPPALVDLLAGATARNGDLVVGEGAMGLFDGVVAPPGRTGATADLAERLGLPVLLVLDISGQSQTAAAIVAGCDRLRPGVRVAGVVLNRVASARHGRLARDAVTAAGFRVVGELPPCATLTLPERHLGLVQAEELPRLEALLDAIADFVATHVDLDAVEALAAPIRPREVGFNGAGSGGALPPPGQRIAIARDAAFSFLYPHLLLGWRAAGVEIRVFSPLADEPPPDDCDVCWLPGGYPELHASRLAKANRFLDGLRRFAATRPVHGECGGYMVLGQTLTDAADVTHRMAGLLSPAFSFAERRMTLGYCDATLAADCCLGDAGTALRGHAFHYATMRDGVPADGPIVMARDAHGSDPLPSGSRRGHVTGTFFHVVARKID